MRENGWSGFLAPGKINPGLLRADARYRAMRLLIM
jgi:hypothetical protein